MMSAANLSAVLLVGGESRRMGRDKATLEIGGKPLWQHQIALIESLKPVEILVSARTDPDWRPPNTIFVPDKPPSVGPLGGITAALGRCRGSHLFVLAIDLPAMNPAYLHALADQIVPGRGVVPMIGDRAEALVAIYPAEAAGDFQGALAGSDHSLQSVVRTLAQNEKIRLVPVEGDECKQFRNLNWPADLLG